MPNFKTGVELDRWEVNEWEYAYQCPICKERVDWKTKYRFCPCCGTRLYQPVKESDNGKRIS